jgi:hypothetical protein
LTVMGAKKHAVLVLTDGVKLSGGRESYAYYLVFIDCSKKHVVLLNTSRCDSVPTEHDRIASCLSKINKSSYTALAIDLPPFGSTENSGVLACAALLLLAHHKDADRAKELLLGNEAEWYKRWRRILLCQLGRERLDL